MTMHSPAHPGAILRRQLDDRNITIAQAARDLGISRPTLSGIVNGQKPITAEMAVRIGHYIGTGPGLWHRMQSAYDLAEVSKRMVAELRRIPAARAAAAA